MREIRGVYRHCPCSWAAVGMPQVMAMIRTGGHGHDLTSYLLSSRSSSPELLPSLGCYANQRPLMRQTLRTHLNSSAAITSPSG